MSGLAMTFSVLELVDKVSANRTKHEADYTKAMDVFRAKAREAYAKRIEAIDNKQPWILQVNLNVPEKHLDDYDYALAMLQMTKDETIELDEDQFRQFVMDKWHWQRSWETNTKSYSG
jgi:hypothetical protein